MNKLLYILVGIPGSGKTTLAYSLTQPEFVCSADDYMVDKDGNYSFNPKALGYVHRECQAKCVGLMVDGKGPIVIANTNTTNQEIDPYILLANIYDYEVKLMEPNTSWRYNPDECFVRNTHGVPLKNLQTMLNRLVDLDDARRYFQDLYPKMRIEVCYDKS